MTVTIHRRSVRVLAVGALAFLFAACYPAQATPVPPKLPSGSIPIPSAVGNRTPLLDCGQETVANAAGYNTAARTCFLNSNKNGTEAEFRSAFPHTVPNGNSDYQVYITVYYRTFKDKHVEIITDGHLASDLNFAWSEQSCPGVTEDDTQGYPSFTGTQPCKDVPIK